TCRHDFLLHSQTPPSTTRSITYVRFRPPYVFQVTKYRFGRCLHGDDQIPNLGIARSGGASSVKALPMTESLSYLRAVEILFQKGHLRPIFTVQRFDARKIVLRPLRTAGPIGPPDPHVTVRGHEFQNSI